MSLRLVGCLGMGVLITVVIIGGVLALRMNGMGGAIEQPPGSPEAGLSTDAVTITYLVTGTTPSADVAYQDANDTTQNEHVSLPWQQSFTMGGGDYAHITAQTGDGSGSLTCEILANGAKWRDASGTGEATCGGFTGTQ